MPSSSSSSSTWITLKVEGLERNVVSLEEAKRIGNQFAARQTRSGRNNDDGGEVIVIVHKLDLSGRAWTKECLQELHLETFAHSVINLQIDDIIPSLPTEQGLATFGYLAEIFANSEQLQVLNLNDNAIGTRGMQKLKPLLSKNNLRSIHLYNCGLAEADCKTLLDWFSDGNTTLESIDLGRNQMGMEGAVYIGKLLPTLTELRIFKYAGSRPRIIGTAALLSGLSQLTKLKVLDLNDCFIGCNDDSNDEDYEIQHQARRDLCTCVSNNTYLQTLVLRDTILGLEGIQVLMKALSDKNNYPGLITLDIGGMGELGEEGGIAIRDYLLNSSFAVRSSTLQNLILDSNELGDEGVAAIAAATSHCESLQLLNLECNEITKHGTKALVQNKIPNLQTLNISDNMDIPNKYAIKLKNMYPKVLVDEDLEDDDSDEEEEEIDEVEEHKEENEVQAAEKKEEDDDLADLASNLAAAHI